MMLTINYYKSIMQSFFESPVVKMIVATLLSLFAVPIEFIVAVPLFWILDFISGLYAAKKQGKGFSFDKLNAQYVKMGIHIAFLLGCTWFANLFSIEAFQTFGFGYVVATEFISTIRNLFGDKKAVQLIAHFKELFTKNIGVNVPFGDEDPEK